MLTHDDCARLDAQADSPHALRLRFAAGAPDTLYFDANSIGPMPADAPARIAAVIERDPEKNQQNDFRKSQGFNFF